MKLAMRTRSLVLAILGLASLSLPAFAQGSSTGGKIRYEYVPPMSLRYVATAERLKQFQLFEQLSEFFSPVRLPHNFSMISTECGVINAFYQPSLRRIELCYEFVESVERMGPKVGETSDISYQEFVVGTLVGVLLHELGHAVFDMLQIPVIGREEDGADAISTFLALQFSKDVARTIVRGSSYRRTARSVYAPLYWDEHGTSLQRHYNALCLAYGGAPEQFGDVVAKGELPKSRADGCAREYEQVKRAFEKTILPYIDREKMRQVQAKTWLKLTPQQSALLQEQQRQQSKTFSLAVCNMSAISDVYAAILVQPIDDAQQWRSYGWYGIPDSGCNVIGSFHGDRAYVYAEGSSKNGKVSWSANDRDKTGAKQCIHPEKAFDLAATAKCQPGHTAVNFIRWNIGPDQWNATWRLTGGKK
jgi:hypothetical protein